MTKSEEPNSGPSLNYPPKNWMDKKKEEKKINNRVQQKAQGTKCRLKREGLRYHQNPPELDAVEGPDGALLPPPPPPPLGFPPPVPLLE